MAIMYAKAAGGLWSAAGTWSAVSSAGVDSVGPPIASTDAIFETGSGNVTIDVASVCRSLDTTSGTGTYGGTLTHNAFGLSIGDATAGAGNIALKFNSGMTYSPAAGSSLVLKSTSATQQTVTMAGRVPVGFQVNGAGSSYKMLDALTLSGNFTYSAGTAFDTATNSVVITLNGAAASFTGAAITYFDVEITGTGSSTLVSGTFVTLARTGTASTVDGLILNGNIAITGNLAFAGNSPSNRLFVRSSVTGTTRTITITGATFTGMQSVDFADVTFSTGTTNLSGITGGAGDGGGNSGITFTAPQTNYWVGNSGVWTDAANHWANSSGGTAGTGRMPLLQDTARMDSSSFTIASQSVSGMVQRFGSVDWTGATNTPTWTISGVSSNVYNPYGSITLISAMTLTLGAATGTFAGRGSFTLTSAGKTFTALTINALGGSITLQDALTSSGAVTVLMGTLTDNGFSLTATLIVSGGALTRVLTLSGITTVNSTGTIWNVNNTGLTLTHTGTIIVSNATATAKTFAGAGLTYNIVTFSGDNITVTGANIYNTMNVNNAGLTNGLKLTSAVTQTVTNFATNGSAGNLAKLLSTIGASAATLSKASGIVSVDYMSIQDSAATGGATWYAGANSTNVSGNTGWIFTAPPSGNTGNFFFLFR